MPYLTNQNRMLKEKILMGLFKKEKKMKNLLQTWLDTDQNENGGQI